MSLREKNLSRQFAKIAVFKIATQVLVVAAFLLAWELLVDSSEHCLIPAPSAAITALYDLLLKGILIDDLTDSLRRVLTGFALASVSGILFGLALGSFARLYLALTPLVELLRPIPPIAWIPLSMTLFGLGDGSACFVIFIGAFYPVLTNTILGVREVPGELIDAAHLLGCSLRRRFVKVIWPASLPSIFAGLKVGLGSAWMCVVAAEMIAARSGLGYEIQLNRQLLRLDRVVAGMIMIGVVGFLMNWLLAYVEKLLLPWRYKQPGHDVVDDFNATIETKVAPQKREIVGASIQLSDVSFSHGSGENAILQHFNLEIAPGEVLCVLGPSGCGKTTLLHLIAGLKNPAQGQILVDDQARRLHQDEITMVFQNSALFPWLTADGNVRFALESRHRQAADISAMSLEQLRMVGLESRSHHYPQQLSGGQQQRVAVARALAYAPRILLMDEPFASLDSQTKEYLQEEMSQLLTARGITVVFVTHDIREAIFLADRVAVLSKSGGKLLGIHKIPRSQPRDASFRYTSEFSEARLLLWNLLKEASAEASKH